jgi:glycosyltransferase involved in cell wall biosynthesis
VTTVRWEHRTVGLAARLAGLPGTVARLMSGWDPAARESLWQRIRHRRYHRWFVYLAATNSEAGRVEVVRRGLLPADRVVAIHNGVDLERFDPERVPRGRFRAELGIPEEALLAVSISRFVDRKGQRFELEALGRLVASRPDVHLVFAGPCAAEDRPYRDALERRAAGFPGVGRIRFLENRRDVTEILADADLLVRAALQEGLPNIALEAMAMRVPVIATGICGTPEAVVDGETGKLVPPGDVEALHRAADELIRAPASRRREMGEAGRVRVERLFTLDRMTDGYERLFERAAAAGRAPGPP